LTINQPALKRHRRGGLVAVRCRPERKMGQEFEK
jgi:hypothetical protein